MHQKFDGYNLWCQLHLRALTINTEDNVWLRDWADQLPVNCECCEFWEYLLEENPPRWHDYFQWSWEMQNFVNIKLDKPTISLEEAKALWRVNAKIAHR